jgi:hypothetical protein
MNGVVMKPSALLDLPLGHQPGRPRRPHKMLQDMIESACPPALEHRAHLHVMLDVLMIDMEGVSITPTAETRLHA